MKLYQRVEKLSQWLKYQATYLEMKYHFKQVLKGKENKYVKNVCKYDRCIGKSVALARLSAKYKIPIIVYSHTWKKEIEIDIPKRLPKYFKKNKPIAFSQNDLQLKSHRFDVILIEERIIEDRTCDIADDVSYGKYVGYKNIDWIDIN